MKISRELGKTSPFFITRLSHTTIPQNLFLENHDHTVCGHETSFLVEGTTQPFAKSFPTAGDGRSQFYRVPLLTASRNEKSNLVSYLDEPSTGSRSKDCSSAAQIFAEALLCHNAVTRQKPQSTPPVRMSSHNCHSPGMLH
jgi:hypothetical protein